jgi:hypothetical protein
MPSPNGKRVAAPQGPRSPLRPGGRPLPGGPTGERGGRPNAVDRGRRRSSADRCNRSRRGVVVPRLGRLDLFPDRSAQVQQAGVSVGSSGSSVHGHITGTRDEHGILFVSCLVVPPCHLALLVPARPRCSGHSCLSWPRFGRPRTWLIGFGRGMSPTGTVGAATQPTPTGGSGIPARWCDSRLSLRTSRGTHGPSTPTRMRRTRLPRPAALEERHQGAGGETRGPGLPKMSVDRSEVGARPTASPADVSTRLRPRPARVRAARGPQSIGAPVWVPRNVAQPPTRVVSRVREDATCVRSSRSCACAGRHWARGVATEG